jgi:hypothetical protein
MRARRWAAWARQFQERHERVGRRYSPAMVLVRFRGGAPAQRIWRPRVWVTVQPHSHLQVNVHSVTRPENRQFYLHRQLPKEVRVAEPSASLTARVRPPRSVPTEVRAARREFPMPAALLDARRMVRDRARVSEAVAGLVTESIARQVIRRSERLEEFVRTLRKGRAITIEQESPARRVLRGNTRREVMPPGTTMSLRPAPAAAAQAAPPAEPAEQPAARQQAQPPIPPAMPTLNIDLVTSQVMDQIDRRVIAWRERMGKF